MSKNVVTHPAVRELFVPESVDGALRQRLDQWTLQTLRWTMPIFAAVFFVLTARDRQIFTGQERSLIIMADLGVALLFAGMAVLLLRKHLLSAPAWLAFFVMAVATAKNLMQIVLSSEPGFSSNTSIILLVAAIMIKNPRVFAALLTTVFIAWFVAVGSTAPGIPTAQLIMFAVVVMIAWVIHVRQRAQLIRYESLAGSLEQSRRQMNDLIRYFPNPIFQKDRDGRYSLVNPAFCEIYGFEESEVIGKTSFELFPTHLAEQMQHSDQRVLYSAQTVSYEEYVQWQGNDLHFFTVKFPLFDHNDQVYAVCGIPINLTNQRVLEARFRELTTLIRDVFFIFDTVAGRLTYISEPVEELSGYTVDEVLRWPRFHLQLLEESDHERASRCLEELAVGNYVSEIWQVRRKDGSTRWVRLVASPQVTNERVTAVFGVCSDISSQVRVEQELAANERLFRQIADNVKETFWLFDKNTERFAYVNPSFKNLTGRNPQELLDDPNVFYELFFEEDLKDITTITQDLRKGVEVRREHRLKHINGSERWVMISAAAIEDDPEDAGRVVGFSLDITETKKLEKELQRLSTEDGLTGLFNRRVFDTTLDREWKRHIRSRSPCCLLMIDVDHFKAYNDCYGHQAGDQCLQAVAEVIKRQAKRAVDIAARYGGEEFALILPESDLEGARWVAEKIRSQVEELQIVHQASDCQVVTLSVGVARIIPQADSQAYDLVNSADKALYEAKKEGRNRVVTASSISATL